MEHQKIINFLDNRSNQPSKFRTKSWTEINYQSRGPYHNNSDIRFKTTMLKSSLCDYSDAYILVKGRITITGVGDTAANRQEDERNDGVKGERNNGVIFKNCALFNNCKSVINNTERDSAKDIDIIMSMYN